MQAEVILFDRKQGGQACTDQKDHPKNKTRRIQAEHAAKDELGLGSRAGKDDTQNGKNGHTCRGV